MSDLISRCELFDRLAKIPIAEGVSEYGAQVYAVIQSMESHDADDARAYVGGQGSAEDGVTDQSVKADAGKPQLTLVPPQILYDIAEVRKYGVEKYHDPDNWRRVDKERYRNALFRHLLAYLKDTQGVDEESGIKHIKHVACNVAFLCELEAEDD